MATMHQVVGGKVRLHRRAHPSQARGEGQDRQYCVEWAGDYNDDDKTSWEPSTNIMDRPVPELIDVRSSRDSQ